MSGPYQQIIPGPKRTDPRVAPNVPNGAYANVDRTAVPTVTNGEAGMVSAPMPPTRRMPRGEHVQANTGGPQAGPAHLAPETGHAGVVGGVHLQNERTGAGAAWVPNAPSTNLSYAKSDAAAMDRGLDAACRRYVRDPAAPPMTFQEPTETGTPAMATPMVYSQNLGHSNFFMGPGQHFYFGPNLRDVASPVMAPPSTAMPVNEAGYGTQQPYPHFSAGGGPVAFGPPAQNLGFPVPGTTSPCGVRQPRQPLGLGDGPIAFGPHMPNPGVAAPFVGNANNGNASLPSSAPMEDRRRAMPHQPRLRSQMLSMSPVEGGIDPRTLMLSGEVAQLAMSSPVHPGIARRQLEISNDDVVPGHAPKRRRVGERAGSGHMAPGIDGGNLDADVPRTCHAGSHGNGPQPAMSRRTATMPPQAPSCSRGTPLPPADMDNLDVQIKTEASARSSAPSSQSSTARGSSQRSRSPPDPERPNFEQKEVRMGDWAHYRNPEWIAANYPDGRKQVGPKTTRGPRKGKESISPDVDAAESAD